MSLSFGSTLSAHNIVVLLVKLILLSQLGLSARAHDKRKVATTLVIKVGFLKTLTGETYEFLLKLV